MLSGALKTIRKYYKFRRPKGSGIYFILLLNVLVFSYQQNALLNLAEVVETLMLSQDQCKSSSCELRYPWLPSFLRALLSECLPKFLYPVVGWLADAKYGRYRVIRSGLWIMWLAAILLLGLSIVNYVIGSDTSSMYGTFAVAIAIYFVGTVGTACFHTNIIPFGIDQMEGCSSEEISSFIHWFYFTRNVNFGMVVEFIITAPRYYCDLNGETSKYDLIISLIQTAFLTAAVCMDFLFSGNLNKDPKIHNPVKKVKAVTKFVLKHKEQVGYRQAVTYTIESPPARSDYAKKPYGGLYSEDDVEDVMAFWRLVVFLIPVGFGGFLVVSGLENYSNFFTHMNTGPLTCSDEYIATNMVYITVFATCIPLYEFIIHPLFRKYICRITVKIGIGMVTMLVGYSCLLAIEVSGQVTDNSTELICIFEKGGHHLNLSPFLVVPSIVVITIGELFTFIGSLEFVCAQSPYGMRGLLFGMLFFIYGVFIAPMAMTIVFFAVAFGSDVAQGAHLSCGLSYLLTVMAVGVAGFILYLMILRWYKYRQRGGQHEINYQAVLERLYDERISQRLIEESRARARTRSSAQVTTRI